MIEPLQMNFPGAELEVKIVLSIVFRGGVVNARFCCV
jgi:hypothetical protein